MMRLYFVNGPQLRYFSRLKLIKDRNVKGNGSLCDFRYLKYLLDTQSCEKTLATENS